MFPCLLPPMMSNCSPENPTDTERLFTGAPAVLARADVGFAGLFQRTHSGKMLRKWATAGSDCRSDLHLSNLSGGQSFPVISVHCLVPWYVVNAFNLGSHRSQEIPLQNLSFGSMTGESTFLDLSKSTGLRFRNPSLHLSIIWRQLELHFELNFPQNIWAMFKVTLPLKHISTGSFVVNPSSTGATASHFVFFETTVAPHVWKKSETIDEEDLNDRFYWNEREQWIRQCDMVRDALDASLDLTDTRIVMKNLMLPTGAILGYEL